MAPGRGVSSSRLRAIDNRQAGQRQGIWWSNESSGSDPLAQARPCTENAFSFDASADRLQPAGARDA